MKKFISLFLLVFLLSCEAYADLYFQQLEPLVKKRDKELKNPKYKCSKELDTLTDKEAINCLHLKIRYLETKNELDYAYYLNTLDLLDLHYNGGLKNYRH
jgi:hypothetical protein